MANDTEAVIDVTLEQALALEQIEKLKRLLASAMDGFTAGVKKSRKEIEDLVKILDDRVEKVSLPNTFERARATAQRDSLVSNATKRADQSLVDETFAKGQIAEIINETKVAQAKIVDAVVKSITQVMRNTTEVAQARIDQESRKIQQILANNDPRFVQTQANKQAFTRQRDDEVYNNPYLLAARTNLGRASDAKQIREGTDRDLLEAKVNRDEMRNLELKKQFNTEEGLWVERRLSDLKARKRQFQAETAIDPYAAAEQKQAAQQISDSANSWKIRKRIMDATAAAERKVQETAEKEALERGRAVQDHMAALGRDFKRQQAAENKLAAAAEKEAVERGKALQDHMIALGQEFKKQQAAERLAAAAAEKEALERGKALRDHMASLGPDFRRQQAAEKKAADAAEKAADAELRHAEQVIQVYRRQSAIDKAANIEQHGVPTVPKSPIDRLNTNGGADLMAVQGRIMMNYMMVGGLFNTAKEMLTGVIELDKELHQFQAISASTNTEMVTFKKNLVDITAQVPFTTLEVTQAATALAQAGLSTKEVTESLPAVAMFATATGSELSQAVDVITTSLTAFNLETSQTAQVANVYTAALNLSKLSVDKLATALNYIGPTAESVGMSLQETTSVLGALSQSGVRASTMGTGLRALLTDLQSPSAKLSAALKAAGLSLSDIDVRAKGFLPVIETLKKAGFDAADAYETLETRSAATYVALSNNTELAYDMQKAFTLSTAAVKANSTQMESLSNTAKNFGGALTSAAYTGLQPILALAQEVMSVMTKVLNVLNQVPGVLTTIGVAASALLAAVSASLSLSLLKSLGDMIPFLGGIASGLKGVATSFIGTTEAVGGFSVGIRALMTLLMDNWVGLLIGAVTLAGAAFITWANQTDSLTASIDALQAKANDLQGDADATAKKISSIDSAIQGVIDRQDELNKNPLERGAKIDELREQFDELGLSIKDSTMSVTDLIRELYHLKQSTAQLEAAQLQRVQDAQLAQRDALLEQQKQLTTPGPKNFDNTRALREDLAYGTGHYDGMFDQNELPSILDQMSKRFGPEIGSVFKVAFGDVSSLKDNPYRASKLDSLLNERIKQEQDPANIAMLKDLQQAIKPIVDNLLATAKINSSITITDKQLKQASIQGSNAYTAFDQAQTALNKNTEKRAGDIFLSNKPVDMKVKLLNELESSFEKDAADLVQKFQQELKKEAPDADPNSIAFTVATARTTINARLNEVIKDDIKLQTKQLARDEQAQSKKLSALRAAVSDAQTQEALKAAQEGYAAYAKSSDEQIIARYQKLIELTGKDKPDDLAALQDKLNDFEQRRKDEDENQARDDAAKAQDLLKQSLDRQQAALKDSARVTQKAIDDILTEMKKNPPAEVMQKLLEKFKELNAALLGQLNKADALDVQKTSLEMGAPLPGKVAANGQAMMAFLMNQMGLSKEGAAAMLGNSYAESSFNITAANHVKGGHTGLFQWDATRWNNLTHWAGTNSPDANQQLQFALHELQTDYPELYQRLVNGGEDPQTLAKSFMDIFERPGNVNNRLSTRMSTAQSLYAASPDLAAAAANDNTQKSTAIQATNLQKSVDASVDAIIKNLTARLNTLGTQAKISTDSKSIKDIQKQIEDTYAKIEEQTLKKFDADHVDNASDPTVKAERQEKIDEIKQKLNQNLLKVMEEYGKAADDELDKPVKAAQAKLDAMQAPDMANKYTQVQIQQQQQAVLDAQRIADAQKLQLIEQQIAEVKARAAAAPEGSDERTMWINQENDLVQRSNELKQKNLALDQARAQQAPTVTQGIQSATQAWAQQNGILDQLGRTVPLAKQMENTWGQVLDGLSSGFSQFFMDITSGTMSAGDAFKKLGLSVVQMFMQIISKALANQIIMSLFGGAGGGSFLGNLFGVVGGATGKATGGSEPPGMATGGRSPSPFRDGVIRKLMPGEYTLRQSAVKMIGRETLDHFNNLGNRQISEGGLGGGRLQAAANSNQPKAPDVNVWVVSPDEKVPPMGPNDVVHIVADNIMRRGSLKTLIHSTATGKI